MSIPDRVYHYTSLSTALEHILPSKKIRLGSLGCTNDPRETKYWLMSIGYGPGSQEPPYSNVLGEAMEICNRIRKNEWLVLCASQDDPNISDDPRKRYVSDFQRG